MRSLYGKFLFLTVVIMISSVLVAFLAVNTYYHQQLKGKNDTKNMNIAKNISDYINDGHVDDLEAYFQTLAAAGYKLFVVDEQLQVTRYGVPFREENLDDSAMEHVLNGQAYHGMRDLKSETFVTGFFSDELANTVGVPFTYEGKRYAFFMRPDIKLLFTEVHYLLGGMVIVMALVSLLAMLVVAKKLIEPITKLTTATKQVSEEKFVENLDINRKDEIGQLAQSFQKMISRLDENDRIRKEFISDVSHDFQSPLLNIKGYADLLMNRDLSVEERENYAQVIQSETDRLSSLTKQLLLLTSLDQLIAPLQLADVCIADQLKETIRKYRWLADEKEISLSMELEEAVIKGDPAFLEKVWENLLSNALKYTPAGGTVEIKLGSKDDFVEVSFQDNGIGINDMDLGRIFDRFYRADHSRTKDIGGTGLGLSIVHEVVQLHKGSIEVQSIENEGTTFLVTLPNL